MKCTLPTFPAAKPIPCPRPVQARRRKTRLPSRNRHQRDRTHAPQRIPRRLQLGLQPPLFLRCRVQLRNHRRTQKPDRRVSRARYSRHHRRDLQPLGSVSPSLKSITIIGITTNPAIPTTIGPEFNYEFYDENSGTYPARRFAGDTVRYWIQEYHLDGIRFDAARQIANYDFMHWVVQEAKNVAAQTVLHRCRIHSRRSQHHEPRWADGRLLARQFLSLHHSTTLRRQF